MPTGYRVILGDGILDTGDAITSPTVTFTTDQVLGTGTWVFKGRIAGTNYNDVVLSGTYYLGTDGSVYFIPDLGPIERFNSASVGSAPEYQTPIFGTAGDDQPLLGTAGDDIIYGGDDTVQSGTGNDSIDGRAGDDTIYAGDGNDTIIGGLGADALYGGDGNDLIDGGDPSTAPSASEVLDWSLAGGDEQPVGTGFTQTTGLMDVTVAIRNDGNLTDASVETTTIQYVGAGEPFDAASSLQVSGTGVGSTARISLTFAAVAGSEMEDEVANVSFRINDIDSGGWQDILTVNAYDADGNPVPVTIVASGNDTVSGQTITAGAGGDDANLARGSALVMIEGPVETVEIVYANGNTAGQTIFFTDVHFDTIPLSGEADTIFGGSGNDTILAGDGDLAYGEDGDDLFRFDINDLAGGSVTIVGGEGGETLGDTLDLTGLVRQDGTSINITNADDAAGGLSGTATLYDGTVITFSEIETIICYTTGTRILTPFGERRIETLKPGDLVVTLDNGPQPIRWIGTKTVRATGDLAPIRFEAGAIGNDTQLLVSPQHRMLSEGYAAQLHFGEDAVLAPALSLVDNDLVTVHYGGMVTYVHMLFDQHEIVFANGAASESFHPGAYGLDSIADPARDELFRLFPGLRVNPADYGPTSRPCVRARDARALVMH